MRRLWKEQNEMLVRAPYSVRWMNSNLNGDVARWVMTAKPAYIGMFDVCEPCTLDARTLATHPWRSDGCEFWRIICRQLNLIDLNFWMWPFDGFNLFFPRKKTYSLQKGWGLFLLLLLLLLRFRRIRNSGGSLQVNWWYSIRAMARDICQTLGAGNLFEKNWLGRFSLVCVRSDFDGWNVCQERLHCEIYLNLYIGKHCLNHPPLQRIVCCSLYPRNSGHKISECMHIVYEPSIKRLTLHSIFWCIMINLCVACIANNERTAQKTKNKQKKTKNGLSAPIDSTTR